MLRRFSVNFAVFSMTVDAGCVLLGLDLARRMRPWFNRFTWVQWLPSPVSLPPWVYLVAMVAWLGVFLRLAMYDGRRYFRFRAELLGVLSGNFWAAFTMAGVLYLSYREISRLMFLLFVTTTLALQVAWRAVIRAYWRWRGEGYPGRKVLIVGGGRPAETVWQRLCALRSWGLQPLGVVGEPSSAADTPWLGNLDALREVIRQQEVDDVILALERPRFALVEDLVARLLDLPVRVYLLPDYYTLALHKARAEDFADLPLLDLRAPALTDEQRLVKRIFDLAITLLSLPLALPLMALVALAIRLDGPGPILFRQQRIGENGRPFQMLKFRTMIPGAEKLQKQLARTDAQGRPVYKHPDDPRVTRVGRFLRRTSLDELPQLFNVLRGEMSLVGPRPELPSVVADYEPWQRQRFAIPPGITGWWQVNSRSDHPMHLYTQEDLYYVQNYSLWLDVVIILKTVWAVLRGKGAY